MKLGKKEGTNPPHSIPNPSPFCYIFYKMMGTQFLLHCLVQEVTGTIPVSVKVVTDREAVVSLDKTVPAVGVVWQLHGSLVWGPHHTKVTCLLSSKDSIMKIIQDREVARHRLEELETEHRDAVLDREWQTDQFEDMLKKFGEEVRRIEDLEKKVSQCQSESHPESISAAAVLECPETDSTP